MYERENVNRNKRPYSSHKKAAITAIRRRQVMRCKCMIALCTLLISIGAAAAIFGDLTVKADDAKQLYKYYTDVRVERGDTLYDIAAANMSEGYDSIQDYLKEVRIINSVYTDDIYYGQTLVVPYYSEELK